MLVDPVDPVEPVDSVFPDPDRFPQVSSPIVIHDPTDPDHVTMAPECAEALTISPDPERDPVPSQRIVPEEVAPVEVSDQGVSVVQSSSCNVIERTISSFCVPL
jgi:hypothetical protein